MTHPTLLFLPGNMCDATLWRDCAPDPAPCPVAMPVPPGDAISEMAAWCLSRNDGPLIPVGFSMGGIVALDCVRQAPDRIAGLVLIGTNPGADRPDRAPVRRAQQEKVRTGRLNEVVRDELMPHYFAAENAARADLVAHVTRMAEQVGEEAFVSQSEALRTRDTLWPVLQDFRKPVLVLCGEEDTICPPVLHRDIAEALLDATFHIVPDAGHMLPIEQPVLVRQHMERWLGQRAADLGIAGSAKP
ncbi:MAG: alpha/beta hydrolase [Litorimonas sp.]